MNIDIAHIFVTALVVFGVVYGLEHIPALQGASRLLRGIFFGVVVFVVLTVVNLIWP